MRWIFLIIATLLCTAAKPVETPQPEKKYYLVEAPVLEAVLQYLATRPYQETFQLIPALQEAAKKFNKGDACR